MGITKCFLSKREIINWFRSWIIVGWGFVGVVIVIGVIVWSRYSFFFFVFIIVSIFIVWGWMSRRVGRFGFFKFILRGLVYYFRFFMEIIFIEISLY